MATYRFEPPAVWEAANVPGEHWFIRTFKWPRGISLYLDGGAYREIRALDERHYKNKVDGVDYFIGGMVYENVPQEVADALTASGYGDGLEEE